MANKRTSGNPAPSGPEAGVPTPPEDQISTTNAATADPFGEQPHLHDPKPIIESLRNHFSVHNRSLAFLFGAGTSTSINIAPQPGPGEKRKHEPLIPGVEGLTIICEKAVGDLGANYKKAWQSLASQCVQSGKAVNIENVLSRVRSKLDAVGDGDTLVGLNSDGLKALEKKICSTIARCVLPANDRIPPSIPHDDFVQWVQRVNRTSALELFTTNYDILFERAFEMASVPVFDGFVGAYEPFFYPDCLDGDDLLPRPKWVRFWKLHGSVNWKFAEGARRSRVVRDRPSEEGEMILPSHRKYDESRKQPYTSFMDRLARVLRREHALLITSGFGFRDDHLNALIYGALEHNPTANVIALWFDNLKENDDLVKHAKEHFNLTVVGPNAGVISGRFGIWQLTQPVDRRTHAFIDTAFDSNAQAPQEAGSPAAGTSDLRGRMRLGDFSWLGRFLTEMSAHNQ